MNEILKLVADNPNSGWILLCFLLVLIGFYAWMKNSDADRKVEQAKAAADLALAEAMTELSTRIEQQPALLRAEIRSEILDILRDARRTQ